MEIVASSRIFSDMWLGPSGCRALGLGMSGLGLNVQGSGFKPWGGPFKGGCRGYVGAMLGLYSVEKGLGFPKIRVPFLEVPRIRSKPYWSLC